MTDYEGDLYATSDRFRKALLNSERAAASEMIRVYGNIWKEINTQIREIGRDYYANQAAGIATDKVWLQQLGRLKLLRKQVESELARFAKYAEDKVISEQAAAVRSAQEHAEKLIRTGLGLPLQGPAILPGEVRLVFNRLPAQPIKELIGFMQDGSPLKELFDGLPNDGGKIVEEGLIQGLALGLSPARIANNIRQGLGGNLVRALTIARTEVLRSYREASRLTYKENEDIVAGWIWRSARNTRTCACCWAMDGTEHSLDERLDDHPNGRCFMVPKTRTWAEIGNKLGVNLSELDNMMPAFKNPVSGIEAFNLLPETEKLEVLGPAKFAAYQDGKIQLKDLVGRRFNQRWGSMRYEKSLVKILGSGSKGFVAVAHQKKPNVYISAGKPVSDAIKVPTGKLEKSTRKILSIIDNIHGDGQLPLLSLKGKKSAPFYGCYSFYSNTGDPAGITINYSGSHIELTMAHEIGHYLDHWGIGRQAEFASLSDSLMDEWRKAVDQSDAIMTLNGYRNVNSIGSSFINQGHVSYLLTRQEQFARSYAQYIAVKSKDQGLLDQLDGIRNDQNDIYRFRQWQEQDFEPIKVAFDNLFLKLGWMK